jgi:thiamine-monophosphate kinase
MLSHNLQKHLSFCFITDEFSNTMTLIQQVTIAIISGATLIRYLNTSFSPSSFQEAESIRSMCYSNAIPFIVDNNILLAKSITADGIHLTQNNETPEIARRILGSNAIIGISVYSINELKQKHVTECDYIEIGPVFSEKKEQLNAGATTKKLPGLTLVKAAASTSDLPVVASGGINSKNIQSCLDSGATGVCVKRFITQAKDPYVNAKKISSACGGHQRSSLEPAWDNEFDLIKHLVSDMPYNKNGKHHLIVPPGDDAALLAPLRNPVITTDTQREGIHFRLCWQTPEEIGAKAVEVTFSDLAASYAEPVCLFVNIAIPASMPINIVQQVYKGIKASLLKHHASLGGGNVSASERLSLDLFAIGEGREGLFPLRCRANPGDGLYCTGALGLARAGLHCLIKKDAGFTTLIDKFKSPAARFDAARILSENNVQCVIDISDGLAGDAKHIAEASNITIDLDLSKYFHDDIFVEFCSEYNLSPDEMAFAGGEDYELLFTCSCDTFNRIKRKLPNAFNVGNCMKFSGKHITGVPSAVQSYQHGNTLDVNL